MFILKQFLRVFIAIIFELTQLSGLYFIYPRSYRLADVNDLINNTVGGMVGYWLTPLLPFYCQHEKKLTPPLMKKGRQLAC